MPQSKKEERHLLAVLLCSSGVGWEAQLTHSTIIFSQFIELMATHLSCPLPIPMRTGAGPQLLWGAGWRQRSRQMLFYMTYRCTLTLHMWRAAFTADFRFVKFYSVWFARRVTWCGLTEGVLGLMDDSPAPPSPPSGPTCRPPGTPGSSF